MTHPETPLLEPTEYFRAALECFSKGNCTWHEFENEVKRLLDHELILAPFIATLRSFQTDNSAFDEATYQKITNLIFSNLQN